MYIAVDFDGTVVDHCYPNIGQTVPNAVETLKALVATGHDLILYTMRDGKELEDAIRWYTNNNIPLFGIQKNPTQHTWTGSNKCYANLYIDDAAFGAPLVARPGFNRASIDWDVVAKRLLGDKNAD
jgi:hypothetical protein